MRLCKPKQFKATVFCASRADCGRRFVNKRVLPNYFGCFDPNRQQFDLLCSFNLITIDYYTYLVDNMGNEARHSSEIRNKNKNNKKQHQPRQSVHDEDIDSLDDKENLERQSNHQSASSVSSSPPRDFDVNIEGQYVPIFDENDDPDEYDRGTSSLASSLSIGDSQEEYATSPVLLTANTSRVIRCPVCEKPMRTFYCAKCIQKGKFVTLDHQLVDSLSDKRPRYIIDEAPPNKVEDEQNDTLSKADIDKNILQEMLQIKLRTLTKKTETLKTLYNDRKLKLQETTKILEDTSEQLIIEKKSYKAKESKIALIKQFIVSRKASVKKRRDAELEQLDELKQHVSRRAYQLIQEVFPIEEINLFEQNSSFVNMETSPLLTFSDGSHHQMEQQTAYSIVEPWLPSNGDYSAYSLWINDNKDQIPNPVNDDDLSEKNPAFRIGAGLAYTTQLVKNLASYLDVILPAPMEPDMFSRELLNDSQFSYNVAKLNTNIVHLCISQGIDISLLNPQRTIKNLMLLFNINICDLGRRPVIEIDNEEAAQRIEDKLSKDISLIRDQYYDFSKFTDEDDASDSEWEISDSINPMEIHLANEQSIQQNSYISRLPLRLFTSFWSGTSS